jgi:hypothetical protein
MDPLGNWEMYCSNVIILQRRRRGAAAARRGGGSCWRIQRFCSIVPYWDVWCGGGPAALD